MKSEHRSSSRSQEVFQNMQQALSTGLGQEDTKLMPTMDQLFQCHTGSMASHRFTASKFYPLPNLSLQPKYSTILVIPVTT
jgi:hypothetical protein